MSFIVELLEFFNVFGIQISYQIYNLQLFSPMVWLSFYFLDDIFWSTNVFILKKSNLPIFPLVACALGVISKKPLLNLKILSYIFPESCTVNLLHLSLYSIWLIFVYNVKQGSKLIILQIDIQFSQHHLFKRRLFPHWTVLALLSKISWL